MSKADWISPEDITLVQPKTPEEIELLKDDIAACGRHAGEFDDDFADAFKIAPETLTLVYVGEQLAGNIVIHNSGTRGDVGKKSMEFGGTVLPEFRDKGLALQVAPIVINRAFKSGKKKILSRVDRDNQEAIVMLNALGFSFVGIDPQNSGLKLYRLTKEESDAFISRQ